MFRLRILNPQWKSPWVISDTVDLLLGRLGLPGVHGPAKTLFGRLRQGGAGGSGGIAASPRSSLVGQGAPFPQPKGRGPRSGQGAVMNNIIYIVGLVVIVMAVLAFFGLR